MSVCVRVCVYVYSHTYMYIYMYNELVMLLHLATLTFDDEVSLVA